MTWDLRNQTVNAKLFSPKQHPNYVRKIYVVIQLLQIFNSYKGVILLVDGSTLSLLHFNHHPNIIINTLLSKF
jgi:hypothetical protein